MHTANRARVVALTFLLLLASLVTSRPAFAQFNLSGDWSPIVHEDQPSVAPVPSWATTSDCR